MSDKASRRQLARLARRPQQDSQSLGTAFVNGRMRSCASMVERRIVLSMVSDDRSCIRSAKLKIIPLNGKDRDFVVDGLGSRAVINSLLACFDAAQGLKAKKKGRG
ncbi:hypothetical protein AB7M74_008327 [Bradyrhizobium japonicum]